MKTKTISEVMSELAKRRWKKHKPDPEYFRRIGAKGRKSQKKKR